ncbi:hypothetical protein GP5015_1082 [gamma proteobacterium HTCC5015]|nr:hypothetical protein GP5015_1082 [gamma proteobacterium HTCC5015]
MKKIIDFTIALTLGISLLNPAKAEEAKPTREQTTEKATQSSKKLTTTDFFVPIANYGTSNKLGDGWGVGAAIPVEKYKNTPPRQIILKLEDGQFGQKQTIGLGTYEENVGASISYAHIESNQWATDIQPNTQYSGIDISFTLCAFNASFGSYIENRGTDSFEEVRLAVNLISAYKMFKNNGPCKNW